MAKPLEGLKVLFVVAPRNFRDEELALPREAVERAGATAVVASIDEGEAEGMLGARVRTVPIHEVRATEVAGAVVVGGSGSPEHLWDNGLVHKALRMIAHDGKPVGALCLSSAVLAKAGLLEGKKATVFVTADSLKALKDGGAKYERRPVVVDGRIVTADGPASSEAFGSVFVQLLTEARPAGKPRG